MDHGTIIAEDSPEKLKESVGKGDNLIFKLNGSDNNIKLVIQTLLAQKEIVSAVPMEGVDNAYRITSLDGIGKIGRIVNNFLEKSVHVDDISIRANSLENVFLALTGRNIRE
jgi:ABC-type multidrug transport system ATPase subunit